MKRGTGPRPTSDMVTAISQLSIKQVQVYTALQQVPGGATVAQLGKTLNMHANTVRGHLDELIAAGVIDRSVIPSPHRGRPSHRYIARMPRAEKASNAFVSLIEVLADAVVDNDADSARRLGRKWADRLSARGDDNLPVDLDTAARHTEDLLREMGFDPVLRPESSGGRVRELGLHACPFITEDGVRPAPVICALHEGFLDGRNGDVEVELRPLDRPGECGARLTKQGS